MKIKEIICGVIIVTLMSASLVQAQTSNQSGPFFTLTILVTPGDAFDYGVYIVKYLKDINIDAKIKVMNYDCNEPNSYPKINKDWDLAICTFSGGGYKPDMRELYTEDGIQNIFNLNLNIPYQNESENMQNEAVTIIDLDKRQKLYYDWQQLVMTNIVPILPLYSPRLYSGIWSNIFGYDMRWGLSDSSPYMSYNGLHVGQKSTDEFNIAYNNYRGLSQNPINESITSLLWELISEPIVQWSPDNAPLKTGLVNNWREIDNLHYKFYIRENIFWNPSFNVSERDSNSNPLVIETSPNNWEVTEPSILIPGLKTGEVSNGINQELTAKDAVFSLLAAANPLISEQSHKYGWLKDCYVDSSYPFAFHVFVNDDPETDTVETKIDLFSYLNLGILPEFFLNSTDDTISFTSGGIKCVGFNETTVDTQQWINYGISAFSCGKFMIDYYDNNSITVLTRSPFWFGIGAIDGVGGKTPFVETLNIFDISNEEKKAEMFKEGKLDLIDLRKDYDLCTWCMTECCEPYEFQTEIRDEQILMAFNLEREFIGGSSNYKQIIGTDGQNSTEACAVRKAICYAIDREEMNQELHDGEYTLAHNPIYLYTAFYYYDDVIKYYNDLEQAWEWMEAAGYKEILDATSPVIIFSLVCIVLILKLFYGKKIVRKRKCSL